MRNKFFDYIEQGVAPSPETISHGGQTPQYDPICRMYSNTWGEVTKTNISKDGNGYYISGSMIKDHTNWERASWSNSFGGIDFGQALGSKSPLSMSTWMYINGFVGHYEFANGEECYMFTPRGECEDYTTWLREPVARTYTTVMSKIPHPSCELGDCDCCTCTSLAGVAEHFNRSKNVVGENWIVSNHKLICADRGYILEVSGDKGIKVDDKELTELLDKEGLGELYLVQFKNHFAIDSQDRKWQALLRSDKNNYIKAKSFNEMTPQQWFEEMKYIITTYN